jgi:hypothetical protein
MTAAGPVSRLPEVSSPPPRRGALLYVLAEPDSGLVCYVGQTRRPRARLLGHIQAGRVWLRSLAERPRAVHLQRPLPLWEEPPQRFRRVHPSREPGVLEEWLALLAAEDKAPGMRLIEAVACERTCGCTFVADCRRARLREAWWIESLLLAGHPLLNRTLPRPGQGETA